MAGGEVRFGTVSMNICESNHRRSRGARALHGHMKNIFRKKPPQSAGFEVTQNENFGLVLRSNKSSRSSFRYGGRHHSGIPGGTIPLYPGGFVGIGTSRSSSRGEHRP